MPLCRHQQVPGPWRRLADIVIWLWLLSLAGTNAAADVFQHEDFELFQEPAGAPLTLAQARDRFARGAFETADHSDLTFGIGARPIWLHLRVVNDGPQQSGYRLRVGTTWVDRIDVHLVDGMGGEHHWRAGDRYPGAVGVVPGVGTVFDIDFAPGLNHVYIRTQALDPLVLPIGLSPPAEAHQSDMWVSIAYGLLYGFLVALIVYNLLFYRVLRRARYLYYSLYVSCFILMNIGYTGQGLGWLWPNYPVFQNYWTLFMMVMYGIAGLAFAARFLGLARGMPRLYRAVRGFQWVGFSAIALSMLLGNQLAADWVAFSYVNAMALFMLLLGVVSLQRVEEGRYFLAAALAGMLGVLTTGLSVWSVIPFNAYTFHAAELGVVIEAAVFAMALAKQLHIREEARRRAEHLAAYDPLTGLRNRRSFHEEAHRLWREAVHRGQALSVVVADIDHFKAINDSYGHPVGDAALVHIAAQFRARMRTGDVIARWGGEELILLLPDTDPRQAAVLAERIRLAVEQAPLDHEDGRIPITVSFGVAGRDSHDQLGSLIDAADMQLLAAKQAGRNRVMTAEAA